MDGVQLPKSQVGQLTQSEGMAHMFSNNLNNGRNY